MEQHIMNALRSAYTRAKSQNEKNHVKTLVTTDFLDDLQTGIRHCLRHGWHAIVASAYVDTHPRIRYSVPGSSTPDPTIEIGDVLFLKTVHQKGRPSGGKAWLHQAKRTLAAVTGGPPITNAAQCKDQLAFAKNWYRFELDYPAGAPSTLTFDIPAKHKQVDLKTLEWWTAVWADPVMPIPSGDDWSGEPWIACNVGTPTSFHSLGSSITDFLRDVGGVGKDYAETQAPVPSSPNQIHGWNELIAALLELCRNRKVTVGHKGSTDPMMSRVAISSLMSSLPICDRTQWITAIADLPSGLQTLDTWWRESSSERESSNAQGPTKPHSLEHDGDDTGFAVVQIHLIEGRNARRQKG
ncbi:hypothetical protein [Variovorax sp. 770b2]|uniref:hypothetical protein n=1 Tax=Variovorax sp. 770b2 TaxID=1566271 RepID=UPI00116068E5|nr:hypothetical protein [Variovorax sp. 770b2]